VCKIRKGQAYSDCTKSLLVEEKENKKKKNCFTPMIDQHIGENQGGKLGKGKIENWIFFFFQIKGVGTRHGERDSMVGV